MSAELEQAHAAHMHTARRLTALRRTEYQRSQLLHAGSSKDGSPKQRSKDRASSRQLQRPPRAKGAHQPPPQKAVLAASSAAVAEKPKLTPAVEDPPAFRTRILACQVCARYCSPRLGRCSTGDRCRPMAETLANKMLTRLFTDEGDPLYANTSPIADSDLAYLTALAFRAV